MLADKITVHSISKESPEPEDIFSSALTSLFPDDTRNQHGDPQSLVTYHPRRFGDIKLTVADPVSEDDRRLFAHALWNASIWLAEAISGAEFIENGEIKNKLWKTEQAMSVFAMGGEKVLELGAGMGLGGIVSALAGAEEVVISDYPTPEIIANIQHNVDANFQGQPCITKPRVQGHEWGKLSDAFSTTHSHRFTSILAADCLWMPWEHKNLAKSMSHFLSRDIAGARAIVVAGFHTGRQKVAMFFEVLRDEDLEIQSIEEIDVDGNKRPWVKERDDGKENETERKRWLVVAILRRAGTI